MPRKSKGGAKRKKRFSLKEDRMAMHVAASERKRGKSTKKARSIGYATVNARKSARKRKKKM